MRSLVHLCRRHLILFRDASHILISDQSDFGLNDPKCLELSELHSQAVDYPKVRYLMHQLPRTGLKIDLDWGTSEYEAHTWAKQQREA